MRGFEPPISCVTGRRFKPLSYTVKVGGAGFEPAKVEPSDLQSDSFNHSEILPNSLCLETELRRSMGHLGFEPRTNRLKVGYSDLTELMSRRVRLSRFWGLVPPPTYVIYHRFSLWVVVGGHLRKCHRQQKRERNFCFPPLAFMLFRLRLTYVYPY